MSQRCPPSPDFQCDIHHLGHNQSRVWHFMKTIHEAVNEDLSNRPLPLYKVAQLVKNLSAVQETWVRSLGQEDPLEKGMATHSSILAWRIQWMEEPGRLQSMGSQRVRHNCAANTLHQKDKGSWKSTHSIAQFMRIRVWSQAYNDKRSNYIKGSHSPSFLVIVQLR